jgi:hypothetical protein
MCKRAFSAGPSGHFILNLPPAAGTSNKNGRAAAMERRHNIRVYRRLFAVSIRDQVL